MFYGDYGGLLSIKMGFLDFIKNPTGRVIDPDFNKKKYILRYLTLKELNKLAKEHISENPKFYYKDEHGIERSRKPTRIELETALIAQIPLEMIINLFPKLKDKLDE